VQAPQIFCVAVAVEAFQFYGPGGGNHWFGAWLSHVATVVATTAQCEPDWDEGVRPRDTTTIGVIMRRMPPHSQKEVRDVWCAEFVRGLNAARETEARLARKEGP
jgi:hypothetical protein